MDVSRTFDELKILLKDNTIGAISEQDVRDFVESVFQYGGLRLPASGFQAGNEQLIGINFICLSQFIATSGPTSADVVPNALNGTITINRAGVYGIYISLSFSGTNNSQWEGSLFKNGANMDVCTLSELLRPSADISNGSAFDPLVISAGDVLEYRLKATGVNNEFALRAGQFNVFRIG